MARRYVMKQDSNEEPLPVYRERQDASGFTRSSSFDNFPRFNGSQPWPMPVYHSSDEFEPSAHKKKHRKENPPKTSKGKKDKSRPGKKKKRSKSTGERDVDNSSKVSSLRNKTSKIKGLPKSNEVDNDVAVSIDGTPTGSIASGSVSKAPPKSAPSGISSVARKMTTQTFVLETSKKKKVPACIFWKYIFYLGLVIFGAIIGVVAYTFYNKGRMDSSKNFGSAADRINGSLKTTLKPVLKLNLTTAHFDITTTKLPSSKKITTPRVEDVTTKRAKSATQTISATTKPTTAKTTTKPTTAKTTTKPTTVETTKSSTTTKTTRKTTTTTTTPPAPTTEPAHCKGQLLDFVKSPADDDGRCKSKRSGIFSSETSCSGFYMCGGRGVLLRVGQCPCDKIFHPQSSSCERQSDGYYVSPKDCTKFHRCTTVGTQILRGSYECHPGLAFTLSKHSPMCEPKEIVPECK